MKRAFLIACVICIGSLALPAASAERDEKVGLLVVDHGEPPEYNQYTYWSFREFFDHLIEMGLIPSWLKAIDNGTVVQQRNCYACEEPAPSSTLIDPDDEMDSPKEALKKRKAGGYSTVIDIPFEFDSDSRRHVDHPAPGVWPSDPRLERELRVAFPGPWDGRLDHERFFRPRREDASVHRRRLRRTREGFSVSREMDLRRAALR